MRICTVCDSLYPDGTDECRECRDGGEVIPVMKENRMRICTVCDCTET